MSLFIKVCGVTSELAGAACVEAGVDAVGFVFDKSPRRVSPETAADLAAGLPGSMLKVAVFRRPTPLEVELLLHVFPADVVQADHDALPSISAPAVLPVYREGAGPGPKRGGRFLYEGPMSGAGMAVDLGRAARLAGRGEMVLAGGLDAANVAGVIETVRPFGVDVSSGVESQPGIKDPGRIHEFVAAARASAERLAPA